MVVTLSTYARIELTGENENTRFFFVRDGIFIIYGIRRVHNGRSHVCRDGNDTCEISERQRFKNTTSISTGKYGKSWLVPRSWFRLVRSKRRRWRRFRRVVENILSKRQRLRFWHFHTLGHPPRRNIWKYLFVCTPVRFTRIPRIRAIFFR